MFGAGTNNPWLVQQIVEQIKTREPDFTIAGIPVFMHQLVGPDDMWVVGQGDVILVGRNGCWKNFTREEFETRIREIFRENNYGE